MKLRNIIPALIAGLTMLVSCNDDEATYLDSVRVSQSIVSLPVEGGEAVITVNASNKWVLQNVPAWLTVSAMAGEAGETNIKLSSAATTVSNDATLSLKTIENVVERTVKTKEDKDSVVLDTIGEIQYIRVMQLTEPIETPISTCAEVNANGDGKTVRVKGVCVSISNTEYGNWYINDGTGNLYIYGTLDKNGGTKNFKSLGIEVGDIVDVEGPAKLYNGTMEMVNVTVKGHTPSSVKVDSLYVNDELSDVVPADGGKLTVFITCKGNGVDYTASADNESILSIRSISTKGTQFVYTFNVAKNEGGDRAFTVEFNTTDDKGTVYSSTANVSQKGGIVTANCKEFNAQEDGLTQYKVRGVITKIANTKYGNLYINDGTGEVYVYGITDWNADNFKVGDEVVLQSVKTSHNNAPQMKNAVVVEKVEHEVKTVAELHTLADNKTTFYLVTGTVFKMEGENIKWDLQTYGNFGLKDETGEIYVYGVADALNGKTKNFAATGIKEGDKITILAYKSSYKGANQIVGQFIKNEPKADATE